MIKNKEKQCKGTHLTTKGMGCGKITYHRVLGLGKMCGCYSSFLLNTETGNLRLHKATLKATKPRKELEQAQKEKSDKTSLGWLLINVRTICHDYIKLRDKYKPCISCGFPWNKNFQAGHFKKAELFSSLKFNEFNINGQCVGCNIRKDGNVQEYELRLPERIGIENFNEINKLAEIDHSLNHKWDREELIKIKKYYQNKIKQLKNENT